MKKTILSLALTATSAFAFEGGIPAAGFPHEIAPAGLVRAIRPREASEDLRLALIENNEAAIVNILNDGVVIDEVHVQASLQSNLRVRELFQRLANGLYSIPYTKKRRID